MDKKKRNKEENGGSSSNNSDDAAVASTSGQRRQFQATNPLTVGQAITKENFLSCCSQFYTLPEMIEFMTTRQPGITAEKVTELFRVMMKCPNADMYLRAAQYHSTVRKLERKRRETEDSVNTPPQGDGASSSS